MELTVRTTGKDEYRDKLKMMVTGPSGSGKTRFGATAPNVLFAEAKGGLMSIADKNVPFVTITCEADLLAVKNLLSGTDEDRAAKFGRPIDTLVIDTADEFARVLLAERMGKERRSEANVSDYGFVGQRLHTIVESLVDLPVHVVMLVHYREMGKDDETRIMKPGFAGQFSDQVGQYFDYSVSLSTHSWTEEVDGNKIEKVTHLMQTLGDENQDFLFDRSGRLPSVFELNFEDDFSRIMGLVARDDISESTSMVIEVEDEPRTATSPVRPSNATVPRPAPTPAPKVVQARVEAPSVAEDPFLPAAHPPLDPGPVEPTDLEPVEEEVIVSPTPAPEPAPAVQSNEENAVTPCTDCNKNVETEGQATMSNLRYREPLCITCFAKRRSAE